ncbi:MAG TPA: ferrous iron transport protein B [Terriglobales bacterium]|jgi:ferrous iron transport protein B|nr:ferrous iron transport protein B [Terriglobales bacterium]
MILKQKNPTTLTVGLAGQPNVGKSTVFNLLTGLNQHVGNWPGKTIERREGACVHDGVTLRLVDLPGTYSLTANSLEEKIARDFILRERPDVVVLIADAAAIERNLYLLAELLSLPAPIVLGVNMMDVARREGIEIEGHVLSAALGLPVVPMVASRAEGVSALMTETVRSALNPVDFRPARPEIGAGHREVLAHLRALLANAVPQPYPVDWVALKLLEGDQEITNLARSWVEEVDWRQISALLHAHEDACLDIASGRYEWIGRMVRAAVKRPRLGQVSFTDRLDRYAVHPIWGMAILLTVFTVIFGLTFQVATPIQEWLDERVVASVRAWLHTGLPMAPQWLGAFLADGVAGGAGTVLTFLPVLLVFFTVLALFEDTGYLARAAYVMDRFMHAIGLHGKSFLPLFLGFGCNVPAVMGARVIEAPAARLLTILLAPFVPCSARLAVLAFLAPAFFGQWALAVAVGLATLNLLVLALVGVILNSTVFKGRQLPFIMELPLYHAPTACSVAHYLWHNTRAFLSKAGTIILLMSMLIWALGYFPGRDLESSYLSRIGHVLSPAGEFLGMDWRMMVALLSSFIAKENALATLGILYGSGESAEGLAQILTAQVAPAAGLAFLTATMLFVPCAATLAVMRQETGQWRWVLASIGIMLFIALCAAALTFQSSRILGLGLAHA